jgi:hypothetical protein
VLRRVKSAGLNSHKTVGDGQIMFSNRAEHEQLKTGDQSQLLMIFRDNTYSDP